MAYLPNADDIGQILGVCVLPCSNTNTGSAAPLGPSYMTSSPTGQLAIDPEFGEVVRGLVMNAYAAGPMWSTHSTFMYVFAQLK